MKLKLLVLVALFASVAAELGLDIGYSQCKRAETIPWTCLKEHNYSFLAIEAWDGHSKNHYLEDCMCESKKEFPKVDLILSLCPRCYKHSASTEDVVDMEEEIHEWASSLDRHRKRVERIWIGVDCMDTKDCDCKTNPTCGWFDDNRKGHLKNMAHITKMLAVIKIHGWEVGVFTGERSWQHIAGGSSFLGGMLKVPLWYIDPSGFADFKDEHHHFGGWGEKDCGKVFRKKFDTEVRTCGVLIDSDYQEEKKNEFLPRQ